MPEPTTPRRIAGSVAVLATQYGATTILTAATTIAVTRLLQPTGYGIYGSAIASWTLLGATADLGTVSALSRDLGSDRSRYRSRLHTAYVVSGTWCVVLTGLLILMAVLAGLSHPRAQALLVLAPSMLFNGLNPATSVFIAAYETKDLLRLNIVVYVVQGAVSVGLAASGQGPVAVAAGVSLTSALSSVMIAWAANRLLPPRLLVAGSVSAIALMRDSVPLAVLGVLTRVYGTVDVVLLGWYVAGPRLGDYAAAAKILTVCTGLAGQVMAGALPGLAESVRNNGDVRALAARISHWLVVSAIPMFLVLALFPSLVVDVVLGARYAAAASLIRILSIYGFLAVGTNLAGNILVAARRMRPLYVQSLLAIALNVGANIVFIPRFGIFASAWITVATEALVCGCSFFSSRRLLSGWAIATAVRVPLAAVGLAGLASLAVLHWSEPGAVITFAVGMPLTLLVFRGWPEEFLRALPWVRRA